MTPLGVGGAEGSPLGAEGDGGVVGRFEGPRVIRQDFDVDWATSGSHYQRHLLNVACASSSRYLCLRTRLAAAHRKSGGWLVLDGHPLCHLGRWLLLAYQA